ncbi:MAG: hypothetical protein ACLRT4_12275 [Thomasclavelia sp.]
MIVFKGIIDLIGALLFTWFIAEFFEFKDNKKRFIFLVTLIQFICLQIFQIYHCFNFFASILIAIIVCFAVFVYLKRISFSQIFVILLYNGMLLIYAVISQRLRDIFNLIYLDLLFRILQFVINIICLRLKNKLALNLELTKCKVVIVFEGLLICLLYNMAYKIFLNDITIDLLNINALLLFALCVLFMYIINLINRENKEKIRLMEDRQKEMFERQKYYAMSNVKNEIDALDHRLFYTIFKIEDYLNKHEYEKINEIIDYYKNKVMLHKLIVDTGNDVFDVLYSMIINKLTKPGHDISNSVLISKNSFYDDLNFINFIQDVLGYFKDCRYLKIDLSENNGFVIFKIIYRDGMIVKDNLETYLSNNDYIKDISFNLTECESRGVRISFKIENEH